MKNEVGSVWIVGAFFILGILSNNNLSIKLLSFVICIKRYKVNSVLTNKAKYKLAQQFNLHPTTFNNYLRTCIDNGYIRFDKANNCYVATRFDSIVKDYFEKTGNYFSKHKILQSKDLNFKNVLRQVEGCVVYDNVIAQQEFKIKTNGRKVSAIKQLSQTENNSFNGYSKSFLKKILKNGLQCVENKELLENYSPIIRTSARSTAKHTGFSVCKSNRLLNNLDRHTRKVDSYWVHGISFCKIELLKMQHPKATIIPFVKYDMIKVCKGSIISVMS